MIPNETETASTERSERFIELSAQRWNRTKSVILARNEGLALTNQHWAVIKFLRRYYLRNGLPRNARTTARALKENFSSLGGNVYLRKLFVEGPVTQGSRLANLRTPAYAVDPSFGTSY
jgi:tRNA 2-thiouridine synthesizing protein E